MEQEDVQMNLEWYAAVFSAAQEKVGDPELARVLVEQVGKDRRQNRIIARDENGSGVKQVINGDKPATDKQRAFLKRLDVTELPDHSNRADASAMIDEALEKESE